MTTQRTRLGGNETLMIPSFLQRICRLPYGDEDQHNRDQNIERAYRTLGGGAIILELLARPNELLTRHQLLDAVWGHRYVTPSTLNRAIVLARKAFADDSGGSSYIQTVHGAGYRYVGPFKLLTVPSREPRARQGGESG
jgi:DNA-binding winged helix-turn-helix (wHTH) protein